MICYSFNIYYTEASSSTQSTIISFGIVSITSAPTSFIFGNSVIGTNLGQNDANAQSISYFTCTATGSITDIIAYINGVSSGSAIAALYAISGGSAGVLLVQSNPLNVSTAFSWKDFQLQTPYTVTSGTTYGLAIMGNIALNLMEGATGQRDHNAVSSYVNGFKNPFGTIWGTDDSGAMSIYAIGATLSPTPTPTLSPIPTSKPSSVNLEPLSAFTEQATDYSYSHVDYSVTHNGNPSIYTSLPSIPSSGRANGEIDGAWVSVNPGDHIVFGCWIYAPDDAPYIRDPAYSGARTGVDFYVSSGSADLGIGIPYYNAIHAGGHPDNYVGEPTTRMCNIQFGTAGWQYVEWDFYIPTDTFTLMYGGNPWALHTIPSTQIQSIVPWLDLSNYDDACHAWFSEPTLYINP